MPATSNPPGARRPHAVAALVALLVVALAGCGAARDTVASETIETSAGHLDVTSLKAAAARWAEGFLQGSLDEVNQARSEMCDPLTAAALAAGRGRVQAAVGQDLTTVHVVRIDTRVVTSASAETAVVTDLRSDGASATDWVIFRLEQSHWKLADCDRLPITSQTEP